MVKKDIIKQIIRDFHLRKPFEVRPRDVDIPLDTGRVITLTGVRRCGKTSVLYDSINRLSAVIDRRFIVYINFEDERLDISAGELDLILQAYLELYPQHSLSECCFYFDEIQNVTGWERFIRRIHDTITAQIVITGSNSRLLASEIATSLRGRTLTREIFPLSFSEYLRFKDIPADPYASKHLALMRNAQATFLQNGGFPEIVLTDDRHRIPMLQEYFNVLLYRDLIERYGITNVIALKYFLKRVVASTTKQLSIHKIYNELKSGGVKTGKNSLYEFLECAQAVWLALVLYRYDPSLVVRELGEKKIYAIDTGLCSAIAYQFSKNIGKTLESAVFLELRRTGYALFYYRDDSAECDFLLTDRETVIAAIQVSLNLSSAATKKRELKGLLTACRKFGLKQGLIITADEYDDLEIDGMGVVVRPFFRIFAENSLLTPFYYPAV